MEQDLPVRSIDLFVFGSEALWNGYNRYSSHEHYKQWFIMMTRMLKDGGKHSDALGWRTIGPVVFY